MKKRFLLILLAGLLTCLCACQPARSSGKAAAENITEEEYRWSAYMEAGFPLGMNTVISGITADKTCVFLAGMQEGGPVLGRMEYSFENGWPELGSCQRLELPEAADKGKVLGLSHGGGSFFLLLGIPEDESAGDFAPLVCLYQADGSLKDSFQVEYADDETPLSIFGLDGGGFCLRGAHHLRLYSPDGALSGAIYEPGQDLYPPLLVNGELLIQSRDSNTGRSALNIPDFEKQGLYPAAYPADISAAKSIVESPDHEALINTGSELKRIDGGYETETVLDWYSLTGDYGGGYRYICMLDESSFLMAQKDSAELWQLLLEYGPDNRETVRIAFCGSSTRSLQDVIHKLSLCNPDYKVEASSYGGDEAGLKALRMELSANDRLDIVISDTSLLDPAYGFADLYPFIDGDGELSRESFLPFITKGLERNGELNQMWSSFSVSSFIALGPLAAGPQPLKLADCQSLLDSAGCDEPLFDSWLTGETLLAYLSAGLLAEAYDAESGRYMLSSAAIQELAALCREMPPAPDPEATAGLPSKVLKHSFFWPEYLGGLEKAGQPYRIFDGADGGDNFACLSAFSGSCIMIPETCGDKDRSWGFLRTLFTADFQQRAYTDGGGFPTNAEAFEAVLAAYATEDVRERLCSLIDSAAFLDYDAAQLRRIFLKCMQPYLYGDCGIDAALSDAEGRINIYAAEHQSS